MIDGIPGTVSVESSGVRWTSGGTSTSIPFAEILAARREVKPPVCHSVGMCDVFSMKPAPSRPQQRYGLSLFSFRREHDRPSQWHPLKLTLESHNQDVIEDLLGSISQGIDAVAAERPRHLLVVLNPNAGSRQARTLYDSIVRPVLALGGVDVQVVETRHAGHAAEIMEAAVGSAFSGSASGSNIDGIVAMGGDGVFHEVMNGFLAACASLEAIGAPTAAAAARLRLAHIPCGSTDAVACSLNGSRSVFAATMHVALGDRTALDVLRVDMGSTTRFACCIATYGFMGDVVQASEKHRWLGPLRYDILGAATVAMNQAYRCVVSYIPPHSGADGDGECSSPCVARCQICRAASMASMHQGQSSELDLESVGVPTEGSSVVSTSGRFPSEALRSSSGASWRVVEGDFMSVMLINQPCRSEKTPKGMARYGHLANGRFTLVLVRRCSPLQYLQFLVTMSSKGLFPGQLPGYVDVLDAVACKVEGAGDGPQSHWNLDGELLSGVAMRAEARQGLIQVFARGPES